MGAIVSLSKFRKEKARAEKRRRGDMNAARFGQTAAERRAAAQERDRARRDLDGKAKE